MSLLQNLVDKWFFFLAYCKLCFYINFRLYWWLWHLYLKQTLLFAFDLNFIQAYTRVLRRLLNWLFFWPTPSTFCLIWIFLGLCIIFLRSSSLFFLCFSIRVIHNSRFGWSTPLPFNCNLFFFGICVLFDFNLL